MATLRDIQSTLRQLGDPNIAEHSQRYFKTGPGEYGAGDQFLGIRVPVLRRHVRQFKDTPLPRILKLLHSRFHEERLFALLLLVRRFQRGDATERKAIYQAYLANTRYINNWDLVDSSAHHIVGGYLQQRSTKPLDRLARSKSLWERRIAIMATAYFIRQYQFDTTLRVATALLQDPEDLIHKAVGWMLREVGKRDMAAEKAFLARHYQSMPRTMLRYAIERFPARERQTYLTGAAR